MSPLQALAKPPRAAHAKDPARELRLFRRYARFNDTAAREELFKRFLPLAHQLANRYRQGPEPLDDLVQVAALGLLKAIDRFDADRGTRFTSFAVPCIAGELKRHFRDHGWSMSVPRPAQERALAVSACIERLSARLGRSPTMAEIAEASGLSVGEVLDAVELGTSTRPTSLDAPIPDDEAEWGSVAETIGCEEEGYELVECRAIARDVLRRLPERERRVLLLRFAEDLKQSEIGAQIGVSQMHVSRILRRALGRAQTLAEGRETER